MVCSLQLVPRLVFKCFPNDIGSARAHRSEILLKDTALVNGAVSRCDALSVVFGGGEMDLLSLFGKTDQILSLPRCIPLLGALMSK